MTDSEINVGDLVRIKGSSTNEDSEMFGVIGMVIKIHHHQGRPSLVMRLGRWGAYSDSKLYNVRWLSKDIDNDFWGLNLFGYELVLV